MTAARIGAALALCLAARAASADSSAFRIDTVDYIIDGSTMRFVLEKFLGIEIGRQFPDEAALGAYIEEKTQLLRNERIFDVDSSIGYATGEGDPAPVAVTVRAVESRTKLAVPFPKYSNANGLSLAVRYKDVNFLGTMLPLSLDLDYFFAKEKLDLASSFTMLPAILGSTWTLSLSGSASLEHWAFLEPDIALKASSRYPLTLFGLQLGILPSLEYVYENDDHSHDFKASLGESAGFGFIGLGWTAAAATVYEYKYVYPTNARADTVREGLSLSTSIPMARLGDYGTLSLSPSTEVFYKANLPDISLNDTGWTVSASLGAGRVDWVGNFRKGASVALSSSHTLHFLPAAPADAFDFTLNFDGSAFGKFSDVLGLDSRFSAMWIGSWTILGKSSTARNWEPWFRGVVSPIYGDFGCILSLGLPVNFAQGRFFDSSTLDAEVFVEPFIDAGLIRTNPSDDLVTKDNLRACGGVEAIIFPTSARAFVYRLSVAYDLMDYYRTRDFEASKLEIFLGLGLQY
jgi:hypothetical protein